MIWHDGGFDSKDKGWLILNVDVGNDGGFVLIWGNFSLWGFEDDVGDKVSDVPPDFKADPTNLSAILCSLFGFFPSFIILHIQLNFFCPFYLEPELIKAIQYTKYHVLM